MTTNVCQGLSHEGTATKFITDYNGCDTRLFVLRSCSLHTYIVRVSIGLNAGDFAQSRRSRLRQGDPETKNLALYFDSKT
jgi:hypothetical protein